MLRTLHNCHLKASLTAWICKTRAVIGNDLWDQQENEMQKGTFLGVICSSFFNFED